MKRSLGLDLGTNSIGWAIVGSSMDPLSREYLPTKIVDTGSRIIPMSQDILGDFERGNSKSQTAERTRYRGIRRLYQRAALRRERLHRVLHILGFMPEHYDSALGWDKNNWKTFGKFLPEKHNTKLAWRQDLNGKHYFLFENSFKEMLGEFKRHHTEIKSLIPHDWTIYYLRKKALSQKISKEELAWVLLNFNQKRGYYQLRDEQEESPDKQIEYHALKVIDVIADEPQKGKPEMWYSLVLENGWIYRRSSKTPLFDWKDKVREFIVTTNLNADGTPKKDADGEIKRSFRAPSEDDWMLLKKKTESDIRESKKTVGAYIFDQMLINPDEKIKGKLVSVVERKLYREELNAILTKQTEFHPEFQDKKLLNRAVSELYPSNEAHANRLKESNIAQLIIKDILFYQRPLKSKKSLIANCQFEYNSYKKEGELFRSPLKGIAKSNPYFQEFRLWQFISNLRIYQREYEVNGKLQFDYDVTQQFLKTEEDFADLFDWLNTQKTVSQNNLLKKLNIKKVKGADQLPYRWNYPEEKEYPCNETRAQMLVALKKCGIETDFLTRENCYALWHLLYSVEEKDEIAKALNRFKEKHQLNELFVTQFQRIPTYKKEYGAYSEKAIKKLLPLMRVGRHWDEQMICDSTLKRIDKIITGEDDEQIRLKIREKTNTGYTHINDFSGIPLWLACYIVYNRHSESGTAEKWRTPEDIDRFLLEDFKQHSLRNPIVEQVISETLRTVRDIWKKHGDFSEIHVELGREMKNTAEGRKRASTTAQTNENTNLRIKALLMELKNDPLIEDVRPHSPGQQDLLKLYEEGVLSAESDLPKEIEKISKMSQPTKTELNRYKLWLEQKYRSPYTGKLIPLSKLFTTAYEIEHVIPQARYFDDSLSNKVICESAVNKKKNRQLGLEFIKNHSGEIIDLGFGETVRIFTEEEYERFIKDHYASTPPKMKKLLLADIPESFIERQINDTRYISKVVLKLLSNIVREEGEEEVNSKNVLALNGAITSRLKKDWGLNNIWDRIIQPRFERLNELSNSNHFGVWKDNRFQSHVPFNLLKGFNKKRIDHRHHALDAIVIACATRSHINYLNNSSARKGAAISRYDLRAKLCKKEGTKENYRYILSLPWNSFPSDVYSILSNTIVSFKLNLRIINKTQNKTQHYNSEGKKVLQEQTKGDLLVVRKAMHKETVYGKITLHRIKEKPITLTKALDDWRAIVDKDLKSKIRSLIKEQNGFDKKKILAYFKAEENKHKGKDISKVNVYEQIEDLVASRKILDVSFKEKQIRNSITDTGIQKILLNYLAHCNNNEEMAFSPEGIEDMNKNIARFNEGKSHKPIKSVRVYEPLGNKFNVGYENNKAKKYVEAAKGTNLYFAIYENSEGKRSFESIPLNEVVENLKQGESAAPKTKAEEKLLFTLSPNELVYLPTEEQSSRPIDIAEIKENCDRIYKMVSCTDKEVHFVPYQISSPIIKILELDSKKKISELGSNNKSERAWSGEMIKETCVKLKMNRLGEIEQVIS